MKSTMQIGRAARLALLWVCMGIMALLSGCATYSTSAPDCSQSYSAACRIPQSAKNDTNPLSSAEQTALNSQKGVVAKQVPASAKPAVTEQYKYFLRNGRKTMQVFSKRSEKYLAYAKNVFRSKGLPEELAYLAIVESGYNPVAKSGAGAAGAWQFMKYTGMKYGLNQDDWQDERLDVYKATVAAADYLDKLHREFGDWPTAIAAYNAGEGKMERACAAAGENTFFGVCAKNDKLDAKTRLKAETTQYVPRFLAVSCIMDNLDSLGFEAIHPEKAPQMTAVKVKPATDLKAMASACSMNWNEFYRNNPHHVRTVSSPNAQTLVYVPEDSRSLAMAFARNPVTASADQLAQASRHAAPAPANRQGKARCTGTYCIAPGETLYQVAKKHGTTVDALMQANNISNPNALRAGDRIKVATQASAGASAGKSGRRSYTVRPNDNLWQISKRMNVSVDDLKRWNKIDERSLHVGQTLVVSR